MNKNNLNLDDFTYLCGGSFDESLIKISISHEALNPKEVTKILHKRPTRAYRKGDRSENGKRIMNHGMWQLATPWTSSKTFEKNLKTFLAKLPPPGPVWERLNSSYLCELTVVLRMRTSNRGATLSSDILNNIAARGLCLELDIYYDDNAAIWAEKDS